MEGQRPSPWLAACGQQRLPHKSSGVAEAAAVMRPEGYGAKGTQRLRGDRTYEPRWRVRASECATHAYLVACAFGGVSFRPCQLIPALA